MRKEPNNILYKDGEKELAELIKQAGNDVRKRRKKTMERHYEKLRKVIEKAVIKRQ